jgi:hypothetical protein
VMVAAARVVPSGSRSESGSAASARSVSIIDSTIRDEKRFLSRNMLRPVDECQYIHS